ncbi:hypothetical protein SERLA73DRAFT_58611 [Serpula lacrymans var. lacrymans S7.3]|uniref:Uncharacterized protein n=1 Tax=Serpula lacrymans var. lacrymans (strain S7.3) TaxID=936435 RepID=F8Q4J9_SERL3|nr:hypothetical protein SERLA73DRAFT_58611 [Serpula lacrymans var. lacrymans S7.3]
MSGSFEVWFCSLHTIVKNILSNPEFVGQFNYGPVCKYNSTGKQKYQHFMSIPNTYGSMFVPIILQSNKTTILVATGQNEIYPINISIWNVHNSVCRAHRNAVSLLGFLLTPKTAKKYVNDTKFQNFRWQLFHCSTSHITQEHPKLCGVQMPI